MKKRKRQRIDIEAARNVAIVIRPTGHEQFEHEDLGDLVYELVKRTELPADRIDTRLGYLYGDAPPPGWEGWTVVTFILDEAGRAALQAAIAAAVDWARGWLRKKRKHRGRKGTKLVFIYGPSNEVLKEVEVPDDGR